MTEGMVPLARGTALTLTSTLPVKSSEYNTDERQESREEQCNK